MINTRLAAFIAAKKPQEIEVIAPEMVQGIAVEKKSEKEVFFRLWENGHDHFDLVCPATLTVWWKQKLEDMMIVFTPVFHWSEARMPLEKKEEITQLVLSQLGIFPKEVKLPERVVYLPVPSWVDAECCNGCVNSASPYSIPCFASEAKQMISEFEAELGKIKEELK